MTRLKILLVLLALCAPARSARLKDLVGIEGVRENVLMGYGLVVGLNGTGDSLTNSVFTQQSLVSMLERLGVNTRGATLTTKNVAAVIVTADPPPMNWSSPIVGSGGPRNGNQETQAGRDRDAASPG